MSWFEMQTCVHPGNRVLDGGRIRKGTVMQLFA